MDHAALLVWIDDNAIPERELAGRLCRRHADALVVPRGWTIDDRRDAIPRLFRSITLDTGADTPRTRRNSEPKMPSIRAELPSLFEHAESEDAGSVDVENGAETAEHRIEPGDDQAEAGVGDRGIGEHVDAGINEESDADETRALPWTPQLTGRYSPDDTGPVSGRLLGRAFGTRKAND